MTKKILHLIETTGPGGAERVLLDVVTGIRKTEFSSVVVLPSSKKWLPLKLRSEGVEVRHIEFRGKYDMNLLVQLIKLTCKEKIDIIHAHLFSVGVYAAIVGIITRRPVVVTLHGMIDGFMIKTFHTRIKLLICKYGVKKFIFVSQYLKNRFIANCRIKEYQAVVIPNGIKIINYKRSPNDHMDMRKMFGFSNNDFLIGAIGNIRKPKRYDLLIRAALHLKQQGINMKIIIVGDYMDAKDIKNELDVFIANNNLTNEVFFLGFHENIIPIINMIDIYVLSSESEGFSIATIEAMAMEKAVLTTKCGGTEEILSNGQYGLLVNKNDVNSISDGIQFLLKNPMYREAIAKKARRHVESIYNLDQILEKYGNLYTHLVQ